MTVYLVHGFNSTKHAVWMAEMGEIIQDSGHPIVRANYGDTSLLTVPFRTLWAASDLAASARQGDVAVGHSNGCTAIQRSLDQGAGFEHLIFINPALPVDAEFMPWVKRVDVFHAPNELATLVGGWWAALNPLAGNWGKMGRVGYQGSDSRVTNYSLGPVGHSAALDFAHRGRTAEAIVALVEGEDVTRNPLFRS